jgi:lipopolysaccharide transport system ATP-binding protein
MGGVIRVDNLSKQYRTYHADRPYTWQDAFLHGPRWLRPVEHFWALKEVSFSVEPGKMVGVLGANGAGKSTLLRIIGGVVKPDAGKIEVDGRIGALLDLGAGFHQDLTGRENIYINGIVSGLTRRQVDQNLEKIVEFAELEEFIDSPLRTYSTGMQMRLGFSISVHIQPDVLLIDEALAVGDISFQQKCLQRIAQIKDNECTILLVSHDPALVADQCDDALWMRAGRLVTYGSARLVADQYIGEQNNETERRTPREWPVMQTIMGTELRINENRIGSMEMEILDVRLTDVEGKLLIEIGPGEPLLIEMGYICHQVVDAAIFAISLRGEDEQLIFETSHRLMDLPAQNVQGKLLLKIDRLDLRGDRYYFDTGVYRSDWSYAYDYHWRAYPLTVRNDEGAPGILQPPHEWEILRPN